MCFVYFVLLLTIIRNIKIVKLHSPDLGSFR